MSLSALPQARQVSLISRTACFGQVKRAGVPFEPFGKKTQFLHLLEYWASKGPQLKFLRYISGKKKI